MKKNEAKELEHYIVESHKGVEDVIACLKEGAYDDAEIAVAVVDAFLAKAINILTMMKVE